MTDVVDMAASHAARVAGSRPADSEATEAPMPDKALLRNDRTSVEPGLDRTRLEDALAEAERALGWRGETFEVRRFLAARPGPAAMEDAATDRLASLIGHELRTPLTSVKGFARLLAEREVPPGEVRHVGSLIADAVDRFDRVVEQLTAYTLLGSGRVEATLEAVAIEPFVERSVARWRDADLELSVDAACSGVVPIDPVIVAIALDELLDNALRFAPDHPSVRVVARRVDGDLLLSVADDGPGMAPAVMAACFDEFTQGQSPLTRDTGGLGLGLAIVRTIAHLHGGAALCDSAPGYGTVVTLALPAL
ncbi:MAG: sensor histidine kinase [Acidimicrobiia bacterium]